MKKVLALFLALMMCLGLMACGGDKNPSNTGSPSPTGAQPTETTSATPVEGISEDAQLTVALPAEPDFLLAPYGNPTVADTTVIPCLFDTLFHGDEDGDIVPYMAESYEWLDDTHIRITIRKGITAVDGTEFNANDVLYTLQMGNTSNYAAYFQMYLNVDNCKAEDDWNVVLELATPNPTFLYILCDIPFHMIDQSSVEASGGYNANILNPQCGTGRYTLKEWKAGQYIVLERNDNYWNGTDDCYYKTIKFTWVSDTASRAINVQSGDVDVAVDLSYADVMAMFDNKNVTVSTTPAPRSVNVTFHCAEGNIFANEKLREAVYYCINSADCAAVLFHGYTNTNETGVPTNVYYYYDQHDKVETSIEKAKQCLAEAGYPDGFEFTLVVEPGAGYDVVAELMQAELLEAGIKMNLDKVELVDYFGKVAGGNYDAYIGTLSCGDAITYLNQCDGRKDYMASHGGPAFYDDEMIGWVDRCYSTDETVSAEAFQQVQRIAFEKHIFVGISDFANFTLTSASVTNYTVTPFGYSLIFAFRPAA